MKSKEYKHIKNFFHNELGLTKEQIKTIAIEAIKDEAKSLTRSIIATDGEFKKTFFDTVVDQVVASFRANTYSNRNELKEEIAKQVARTIEVSVKLEE